GASVCGAVCIRLPPAAWQPAAQAFSRRGACAWSYLGGCALLSPPGPQGASLELCRQSSLNVTGSVSVRLSYNGPQDFGHGAHRGSGAASTIGVASCSRCSTSSCAASSCAVR